MIKKTRVNELWGLVDAIRVRFDGFQSAFEQIRQWHQASKGGCSLWGLVIGESGTGKSMLLENYVSMHPPSRDGDGVICPILAFELPSSPTPVSAVETALEALGDPCPFAGSLNSKKRRLVKLIEKCGVELVLADEFHGLVDRGTEIALFDTTETLKEVSNRASRAFVGVGLRDVERLLRSNEQFQGRSMRPVELTRFDWADKRSQDQFVAVLKGFGEAIQEHFDIPDIWGAQLALRFFLGSGGLIRNVAKILRAAVWNALSAGKRAISGKDLERACDQAVWLPHAAVPNPLSPAFKLEDLAAKIEAAKNIGAKAPRPTRSREKRRGRRELASIGM